MASPKRILLIIAFVSLAVYVAGVITGITVQKFYSSETQLEILTLKENIASLKTKMENLQVQTLYFSLSGQTSCDFLVSSSNEIRKELSYFWDRLPQRLEEYEKLYPETEEYVGLKTDYTFVVLRSWLLSLSIKEKCNKEIIPTLYFYSKECETCIEQGKVLDKMKEEQPEFSAFIIDYNLDEPVVRALVEVYNITDVPAFVIENKAYLGFRSIEELRTIISGLK